MEMIKLMDEVDMASFFFSFITPSRGLGTDGQEKLQSRDPYGLETVRMYSVNGAIYFTLEIQSTAYCWSIYNDFQLVCLQDANWIRQ